MKFNRLEDEWFAKFQQPIKKGEDREFDVDMVVKGCGCVEYRNGFGLSITGPETKICARHSEELYSKGVFE